MAKECKNCQTNQSERERKEQLAQWISKEITSREYTDKEMRDIYHLIKQGKQKEAWKILLKDHKCPATCYCQKPARTWQEKIQKGQLLVQLAEREGKEAEKLRIKETAHLLTQQFK